MDQEPMALVLPAGRSVAFAESSHRSLSLLAVKDMAWDVEGPIGLEFGWVDG